MTEDEFQQLADAYDPGDRVADCPDPDAVVMERMEVDFCIPVAMTQDQQGRFLKLVDEITSSPWNEPKAGVHWMAEVGSKPNWSRADCRMLGKLPAPGAPDVGEPTFDDSIYHIGTYARAFVSDKEQRRVIKRREKQAKRSESSRPRVVCLCGSTRFKQAFIEANFRESLSGKIVLSVGFFSHADAEVYVPTEEEKALVDAVYLHKVAMADEILVLNVGGYVGESTKREIKHAINLGKPVRWLELPLLSDVCDTRNEDHDG